MGRDGDSSWTIYIQPKSFAEPIRADFWPSTQFWKSHSISQAKEVKSEAEPIHHFIW